VSGTDVTIQSPVMLEWIVTTFTILLPVTLAQVRFPGSSASLSSPRVSPCGDNADFCTNPEDYPRGLRPDPSLAASTLIKDKIFSEGSQIRVKIGSSVERACQVRRSVTFPRKARNVRGSYLFIMNQKEFRQAVEVEQCVSDGQQCATDSDAPSPGSTNCRQEYSTHRLYAVDGSGEQVYDSFSLPSACLCHHRSNFNVRNSFLPKPKVSQLPICKAGVSLEIESGRGSVTQAPRVPRPPSSNFRGRGSVTESPRAPRPPSSQFRDPVYPPLPNNRKPFNGRPLSTNDNRPRRQRGNLDSQERPRRNWRWQRDVSRMRRRRQTRRRRPTPSRSCPSSTRYCEDIGDYPDRSILNRLRGNPEVSYSLFSDVFNGSCTVSVPNLRFDIKEEQLCQGLKKVVFPRKALNTKKEWMFVVNIGNYTQSVEVEECQGFSTEEGGEFGSCQYSGSSGNNPEATSCRQVYREHRLLALKNGGQLEVDSFKLPSACACFVTNRFQLANFLRK